MTGHRSSRRGETRGIWNDEQYVNLAAAFGQTDSRRMIQTGGSKPCLTAVRSIFDITRITYDHIFGLLAPTSEIPDVVGHRGDGCRM